MNEYKTTYFTTNRRGVGAMSLRKFGIGEVTEVEDSGITKEAVEQGRRKWTPRDEAALEEESKEGPRGGELPPTS